jgi:hypothetical protein
MDCPHCGEEALLGSKICLSCGRNMMTLPAFRPSASATSTQLEVPGLQPPQPPTHDFSASPTQTLLISPAPGTPIPTLPPPTPSPDAPPPERGQSLPVQALCRICLESFDKKPEDVNVAICSRCRNFAPQGGGDAGQNDVMFHPNAAPQADVDPRSMPRMKPVAKRSTVRVGAVVAAAGLVLGLVGVGVIAITSREKDPIADYLVEVKQEDAKFVVAPAPDEVARLTFTLNLSLVHEMMRASFSSKLDAMLSLEQKSVQQVDVAWVRDDDKGVVLDVASECRVAQQTGVAPGMDGRDAAVYPWQAHQGTIRILAAPQGAPQILGGGFPVVGKDVAPFMTLKDVGAPVDVCAAGASWRTTIVLPLLMNRDGALLPAAFPCEVAYVGRRIQAGVSCWVLTVRGNAPQTNPAPIDDLNRSAGSIRAALFYDAKSGVLVEAHGFVDLSAWLERGRIEDRVHVGGTFDARRR